MHFCIPIQELLMYLFFEGRTTTNFTFSFMNWLLSMSRLAVALLTEGPILVILVILSRKDILWPTWLMVIDQSLKYCSRAPDHKMPWSLWWSLYDQDHHDYNFKLKHRT
jgi:hypothetical protein